MALYVMQWFQAKQPIKKMRNLFNKRKMKAGIIFICTAAALVVFTTSATVTDQEKQTYRIAEIGKQSWMVENLNVSFYRNGDSIPQVKNAAVWAKLKTGAWCYYDNKKENGVKYGKLYNWYAVNDPRGLAPVGFHIPNDEEWNQLSYQLGGDLVGAKIKTKRGWKENENGNNEVGFSALPGGYRYGIGPFLYAGNNGCFWSATESKDGKAWGRTLGSNYSDLGRDDGSKASGLSVRCVVN